MIFDLMKSEKIKDDADFESRLNRLYGVKSVEDLTKDQANALIVKLGQIK